MIAAESLFLQLGETVYKLEKWGWICNMGHFDAHRPT